MTSTCRSTRRTRRRSRSSRTSSPGRWAGALGRFTIRGIKASWMSFVLRKCLQVLWPRLLSESPQNFINIWLQNKSEHLQKVFAACFVGGFVLGFFFLQPNFSENTLIEIKDEAESGCSSDACFIHSSNLADETKGGRTVSVSHLFCHILRSWKFPVFCTWTNSETSSSSEWEAVFLP